MCTNTTLSKRKKRNEHNIVVEEASDDGKQWDSKEQHYRISEPVKETETNLDPFDKTDMNVVSHHSHHRAVNVTTELSGLTKLDEKSRLKKLRHLRIAHAKEKELKTGRKNNLYKIKTSSPLKMKDRKSHSYENKRLDDNGENDHIDDIDENEDMMINTNGVHETTQKIDEIHEPPERDFAVYEIGHPELWYTVHVQLFEKLSTADGKTVWNDLTKGDLARYLTHDLNFLTMYANFACFIF